jgi:hypothetical protein
VVITTVRGHQATVIVVRLGEQAPEQRAPVDVLLGYRPPGRFLIDASALPSSSISETAFLAAPAETATADPFAPVTDCAERARSFEGHELQFG